MGVREHENFLGNSETHIRWIEKGAETPELSPSTFDFLRIKVSRVSKLLWVVNRSSGVWRT